MTGASKGTGRSVARLLAQEAVFPALPRASYLSGAHIPMDGGQRKALTDR